MLKRLALAASLASLPVTSFAQDAARTAPVCDGSEIRHAERVRDVGRAVEIVTAAADVVAMLTIPRSPAGADKARSHFLFVTATLPIPLTAFFVSRRAAPGETFWRGVITRMKVGETRAADVRLCLHRPDLSSSSTAEERWTYVTARPAGIVGGTLRTLRLTFRDSVLANVERTEAHLDAYASSHADFSGPRIDRYHGFCTPPIPAVADPFPTPADTSFAAAAMARAQADADAASKNAAAAAAYAACMASDTAR